MTTRISDPSGAQAPYITLSHDSGQSAGFGQMSLISGSSFDGTYERTVTIPAGSAPGAWDVSLYPLRDNLGNSGSFGPPASYPQTLTVSNGPSDVSPPTLHSFDFTPKTVDVSKSSATVKVTTRISDPSGAQAPYITLSHDSGQSAGFGQMSLISGSSFDGTYERTVTIPAGSAPGAWDVSLYPLRDNLGNSGSFGPPASYPHTLTVTYGPVVTDTPKPTPSATSTPKPTPTATATPKPTSTPAVPGATTRLAGDDRYQTSVAISKSTFKPGVNTVYIANGTNFPDALSGAPVAGANNGPVLLIPGNSLPDVIKTELTRLKPKNIVILGGNNAVTTDVANQLRTHTKATTTRLAGDDRYQTSVAISKSTFKPGVNTVYIANG
ncbi:cell wall-binding repeat-containing protein, partial [Pseudoclavibacter sp. JAI123]